MNAVTSSTPAIGLARRKPQIHSGFMTAISAPIALIAHESFRKWMLAVAVIDIALQLDINLRYNERYAMMGSIGGFNVSVSTAAIALLYFSLFVERLVNPWKPLPIRCSGSALLYVGMCGLSLAIAPNQLLCAAELFLLGQVALLYLYVASTTQTVAQVRAILVWLLMVALLESLVFAILAVVGHSIILPALDARVDSFLIGIRIGGTVGSPNGAGAFFAVCVVIALTLLFGSRERRLRRIACAAAVTGVVCLGLTFSRGAWLAFIIVSIFVCASLLRAKGRSVSGPVVSLILLFAVLIGTSDAIQNRLFRADTRAASARVPLMQLAGEMIVSHPLLGVGANNYPVVLPRYARFGFAGDWLYTVHNKYLLVWAETGTIALIAFTTFLWSSAIRAWRVWKRGDERLRIYGLAVCAALMTLSIHMCFDIFRGRASIQLLWLIAGLALALHAMDRLRPQRQTAIPVRHKVRA